MKIKPIVALILTLAVVIAALLAVLRLMNVISHEQLYDGGLKVGAILLVMLVGAMLISLLSRPRS